MSPWDMPNAPQTEAELKEFSAGECEHAIRERFLWLVTNGYRATAWTIWEEMGLALKLEKRLAAE